MMRKALFSICLFAVFVFSSAFYVGEFQSDVWRLNDAELKADHNVKFVVAMALRDADHMHHTLLDIANPASSNYGKYMSLEEVSERYGPTKEQRQQVVDFFQSMHGATVHIGEHSDLFQVTAPVSSIHASLKTQLGWVSHAHKQTEKMSVRAMKPISVPDELHSLISFVSLNVPVNHAMPRAAKSLAARRKEAREAAGVEVAKDDHFDNAVFAAASGQVGISPGNQEALAFFKPFCGSAATETNQENPPCKSSSAADPPAFTVQVSEHANIPGNPYLTSQEPKVYAVSPSTVYCYNTFTANSCSGADGSNCTCIAKVCCLTSMVLCTVLLYCMHIY